MGTVPTKKVQKFRNIFFENILWVFGKSWEILVTSSKKKYSKFHRCLQKLTKMKSQLKNERFSTENHFELLTWYVIETV